MNFEAMTFFVLDDIFFVIQHFAKHDGDYGRALFDQGHNGYLACGIGICHKQQAIAKNQGEAEYIKTGACQGFFQFQLFLFDQDVSKVHQGQNQHEPELQRRTGNCAGGHNVFVQSTGNTVQEAGQIQKQNMANVVAFFIGGCFAVREVETAYYKNQAANTLDGQTFMQEYHAHEGGEDNPRHIRNTVGADGKFFQHRKGKNPGKEKRTGFDEDPCKNVGRHIKNACGGRH